MAEQNAHRKYCYKKASRYGTVSYCTVIYGTVYGTMKT